MILKSVYNEKTLTEKVWYDSSTVLYSEFIEHENDNNGELFVTFKNGSTYHYSNVDMVKDYVMFKNGGLDNSQGKALNKHIKANYAVERVENKDVNLLLEEMNNTMSDKDIRENTYFISGHRNITEEEFEVYRSHIYSVYVGNPDARFVVGDYQGADIMAQNFLLDIVGINPENIVVYHMGDKPNHVNPKVINFKGGFDADSERDAAMTNVSAYDIAFVRDNTAMSGTAENILRRFLL